MLKISFTVGTIRKYKISNFIVCLDGVESVGKRVGVLRKIVCSRCMEKLYQYLWKSKMFGKKLTGCGGVEIEIIDPGRLNKDSGPDFFNSKIKIDGIEWVGNIEIHVKASDWKRHQHHEDPAYDSIILHAVGVSDCRIERRDGSLIPQVEMTMPEDFFRSFSTLSSDIDGIRCGDILSLLPELVKNDWLESLAVERIQEKATRVKEILSFTGNDWEQTCFIIFARALGFGLNSEPFEILGRSLPLKILHHHSDNPLQIQALLFGQAAMLDSSLHIFDEYYQWMCREYYFLARKYGLRPMRQGLWKYARTRPQNFPHRRIAFLAKTCEGGFSLFSKILDASGDAEKTKELFHSHLEGYWHDHFSFDVVARSASDTLSDNSLTLLLINVAAPLLYAYGALRSDPDLAEKGISMLERLPSENNGIVRQWKACGVEADNAWRSQSLLHLRKQYCDTRKCLYCRFGHNVLKLSVNPDIFMGMNLKKRYNCEKINV